MAFKKVNRFLVTLESDVRSLALKFYDEQLIYDWDFTKKRIKNRDKKEVYIFGICHDLDFMENDSFNPEKAKKHYHVWIKFRNKHQRVKTILKWLGIKFREEDKKLYENHGVELISDFSSCLMYATHEDNGSGRKKFKYSRDKIISNLSSEELDQIREGYSRVHDVDKITKAEVLEIQHKIMSGEIRQFEKFDKIPERILLEKKSKIDEAFKLRAEKMALRTERSLECIFLSGSKSSGGGKTELAKKIARDKGLSFGISSGGKDILGEYMGQDVLILDDLRPSTMGMADLLKLLDNHTNSSAGSRYYNKALAECKLIIITSILPLDVFFNCVFKETEEDPVQLSRRCGTLFTFREDKTIAVQLFDDVTKTYGFPVFIKNDFCDKYEKRSGSVENAVKKCQEFGFTVLKDDYECEDYFE